MQGETWLSQSGVKVRIEEITEEKVIYRYVKTPSFKNAMPVEMFKKYFRKG